MYDKFVIKGELKIIPKERKQLKNEASPTLEHQFVPIDFNHFEDEQHCQVKELQIEQRKILSNEKLSNNLMDANIPTEQDLEEPPSRQHVHDIIESQQKTEAKK
ncbi:hypothetical protein PV328_011836 [Microctonus aethiopoides]|uniref:Uncharacterized protein n=1 Tax=Microctonus aethiopoides TaxID=144406 RepID=A0AA39KQA0_9HYME|nr:hypothetical protein PV328_011836 [Microctonus aethiopoides]